MSKIAWNKPIYHMSQSGNLSLQTHSVFTPNFWNSKFLSFISLIINPALVNSFLPITHYHKYSRTSAFFYDRVNATLSLNTYSRFALYVFSQIPFITSTIIISSHQENHFRTTFTVSSHHLQSSNFTWILKSSDSKLSRGPGGVLFHSVCNSDQFTALSDSLPAKILVEHDVIQTRLILLFEDPAVISASKLRHVFKLPAVDIS